MPWESLTKFVERAVAAGVSRDRIAQALDKAGWQPAQVSSVMNAYAEDDLTVAVPRPAITPTARELFLYLMAFSCLYMTVFGLGTILYQLINLALPDPADHMIQLYLPESEGKLRYGMSTLVIFLPAYLFLDRKIEALNRSDPDQRGSSVRRKLTYLTLYLTAIILLSDASYLVNAWLSGELGKRAFLKCLVVALLGVLVLGRYLNEMSSDEHFVVGLAPRVRRLTLGILVLGSLAAVFAAYRNVDSPGAERRQQVDRARESALQQIDSAIMVYHRSHNKLPDSLDQLSRVQHIRFPRDPELGKPYRYVRLTKLGYQLCSTFHAAKTAEDLMNEYPYMTVDLTSTFAEHPAGDYCFTKEVEAIPPKGAHGEPEQETVPAVAGPK